MTSHSFLRVVSILGLTIPAACSSGTDPGPVDRTGQGETQGGGGLPEATGGSAQQTGGAESTAGTPGAGGALETTTGGSSNGGSGGTSGSSNTGGANAGGAGGAEPVAKPPCLSDSNQIVMFGDSYINWVSHTFPTDMNAASSLTIEDFAIGGTSMGSGGIGLIPPQFDTALGKHPDLIAVIMDGGGNDILVPDTVQFPQGGQCKMMGAQSPSIPDCQKIVDKALTAGKALFLHMADSGVKDAIFFFYPHVPLNTLVGGTDPNGMLDYALPKIKAECDGAYEASVQANPAKPIRCHFIDMGPVFAGHPEFFAATDIHPNPTGSKAMAAAVWAKMQQDCVAQPASSGCCAP